MSTSLLRPAPATVPRWLWWTAHVVPLLTLPSGLWRIAFGVGLPIGVTGAPAEEVPGLLTTSYVIVLSAVAEGLALLTLGLVQPWGEVAPRWLPVIGGRPVPVAAAAVPAALGATALCWLGVTAVLEWGDPAEAVDGFPTGAWAAVMAAAYAPLLLWGPLLAVVTAAYVVRRAGGQRLAP